jgi:hypothetical protein
MLPDAAIAPAAFARVANYIEAQILLRGSSALYVSESSVKEGDNSHARDHLRTVCLPVKAHQSGLPKPRWNDKAGNFK